MLRPHELRELLEREVREAFEQLRADDAPIDPSALAAMVLDRHQALPEVRERLAFLWMHLEAYAQSLTGPRDPPE